MLPLVEFFQFRAVLGKIWQNHMLTPLTSGKSWIRHLIHPRFETQVKHHQNLKEEHQWSHKKDRYSPLFWKRIIVKKD